jgi:DNA-binding transcriptional regulator YiaG
MDLKVLRVRARVKATILAQTMGVTRQRVSAIEALADVPEDAARRYQDALMSLTATPEVTP